jgi:hypothetical protein
MFRMIFIIFNHVPDMRSSRCYWQKVSGDEVCFLRTFNQMFLHLDWYKSETFKRHSQ